ncbi:Signaling protein YkoW [Choanephora cucurbitarum]|uniref:Signaling protein YkoW n=1 Tax=Choanephora cucurbitarum TaxID=101091 RepID=A0A1C7NR62_9FUNG|nr:Signaling protein YkoW [Choanephora cucurbitarum]
MSTFGQEAERSFNGGIIFVSYLISAAGALTTLELLTRRTHIRGLYNWFLLASAAFTMGAVGIWSMHFIGNNSLTLILDDKTYQLSYQAGYTFASLVVSFVCMFLAFTFVGITEEVKLARIIPSGIFTGLGVACMHYMGQFAIEYFVIGYKIGYVVGAIIIACAAATIALYIFFKLREQWADQWWKRVGCAMILALAVCGMHYTALVGTEFHKPMNNAMIPVPKLQTPALIGIISAIIVSACIALLFISIKTGIKHLPMYTKKDKNKRLILDSVIFDPLGHVLVNTDGTLPMTEVVHNLELNETQKEFNANHPLFHRLFQTSIIKASFRFYEDTQPSALSMCSTTELYDNINTSFVDSIRTLRNELRFTELGDLGVLSDIVVTTDIISKSNKLFGKGSSFKSTKKAEQGSIRMFFMDNEETVSKDKHNSLPSTLGKETILQDSKDNNSTTKTNRKSFFWCPKNSKSEGLADEEKAISTHSFNLSNRLSSSTNVAAINDCTTAPSLSHQQTEEATSTKPRLSVEDSDGEDKHIFMIRKLTDEAEVTRLLSQGYRFTEPVFISKIMAAKLRIPIDHMRHYFVDMLQMANSVCGLTQPNWRPTETETSPNLAVFKAPTQSTVYVGAFILLDESKDLNGVQLLVDKSKRFAFPMVQLTMNQTVPTKLDHDQLDFISSLHDRSLFDIAELSKLMHHKDFQGRRVASITDDFIQGLERTAQHLLETTSYSKALYRNTKLHATVLDLTPFALTTGPCQLIVFRSFINTPGAIAAVNHTFSEPIKCMPLDVYKHFCNYVTEQAVNIYQDHIRATESPSFVIQQQIYRPQTLQNPVHINKDSHATTPTDDVIKITYPATKSAEVVDNDTKTDMDIHLDILKKQVQPIYTPPTSPVTDAFSLLPPPRAKRNRHKHKNSVSSIRGEPKATSERKALQILKPVPLSVLPVYDRFWWFNSLVEETIHHSVE